MCKCAYWIKKSADESTHEQIEVAQQTQVVQVLWYMMKLLLQVKTRRGKGIVTQKQSQMLCQALLNKMRDVVVRGDPRRAQGREKSGDRYVLIRFRKHGMGCPGSKQR